MSDQDHNIYEFGPFRLDARKRLLMRGDEIVPLKPKAFDTLLALVEGGGRVLEEDELMKRVWPDTVVEEGNLTFNISSLRKALGERPNQHEYIVTIPGESYRFVAGVRAAFDEVEVRERTRLTSNKRKKRRMETNCRLRHRGPAHLLSILQLYSPHRLIRTNPYCRRRSLVRHDQSSIEE